MMPSGVIKGPCQSAEILENNGLFSNNWKIRKKWLTAGAWCVAVRGFPPQIENPREKGEYNLVGFQSKRIFRLVALRSKIIISVKVKSVRAVSAISRDGRRIGLCY